MQILHARLRSPCDLWSQMGNSHLWPLSGTVLSRVFGLVASMQRPWCSHCSELLEGVDACSRCCGAVML